MNDEFFDLKTEDCRIGEGLRGWSLEPGEGSFLESVGSTARITARQDQYPGESWTLEVEYSNGETAPIPFCTADALKQWMTLCPEVRSLLAETGWKIARHEAMHGCLGTAISCCLHFQILVDDPSDRAVLLLELARMMERTASWTKSLSYYRQAVMLEPMDDSVWKGALRGMARGHEALGNKDQAAHFRTRAGSVESRSLSD